MGRESLWIACAVGAAVCWLSPRCAAQTVPSTEASAQPAPQAAPSAAVEVRDLHRGRRLLWSSLAGVAGGLGGALAGGLVGAAIGGMDGDTADLGGVALLASVGFVVGLPLGVTLAGNAQGGNGGYGWALLGSLGGGLALGGLGLAVAIDSPAIGITLGFAGGLAGAMVGYELSNDAQRSPRPTVASRVLPTVGADATGLRLGLCGTF